LIEEGIVGPAGHVGWVLVQPLTEVK